MATATTMIIEPRVKHTASMFILHGLGDSAEGWIDVAEQLSHTFPHIRFVLPSATDKPVTMNGGMHMPSWYDIKNLSGGRSLETCDGLEDSVDVVHALIAEETKRGIPYNRMVMSGFSQGGAMSLWVGLQFPHRLAGVLSMSGYLPRASEFKPSEAAKDTPTLFCHGTSDNVVQFTWAQAACERIKQDGVKQVEFIPYPRMVHTVCDKELGDVHMFIQRVLGLK